MRISFTCFHLPTERPSQRKRAWRNQELRKSHSPNQRDLGSSVSPEKWASGYRYFCKINASGPLVPLNHTICKCIKNTHKDTVLTMLIQWLPAGLVHVNTAQFHTIFRKTMQQKTSSKQFLSQCFQAWSTTILLSKINHSYHYQPSSYQPACYRLFSNGTFSRSQKWSSSHNMQAAYVLTTPLTGLGAPQGLAGWGSGVFVAETPKTSSGWDPETL